MENMNNVIPKVTVEEFNSAPETIEMTCRSGWENIKAQDNDEGLQDYAHVKLDKGYVTYKIVGAHMNDIGQVSLSLRKIKATQTVSSPELEKAKKVEGLRAQIASLEDEIAELCF